MGRRGEEARRYYEKGVQVGNTSACEETCLQQKRDFYQRAVDLCPGYSEAHINLGDVLEKLGRYPEALTHYTKAVELTPDFAIAHFGLGDFYLDTGDYARAVAAYDKGLGIDPDNSGLGLQLDGSRSLRWDSLEPGNAGRSSKPQPTG